MYKIYFLSLLFFYLNSYSQETKGYIPIGGTSIIVLASNDSIWIAADSKAVGDVKGSVDNKIAGENNIFYCFSGMPKLRHFDTEIFNCYSIMRNAIKKGKTLSKSFDFFNDSIIRRLTEIFKIDLDDFDHFFNQPMAITTVSIASFVDGKPNYITRGYCLRGKDRNNWSISIMYTEKNDGKPGISPLGFYDNILQYLKDHPAFIDMISWKGIKEKLLCLIKLEADAHSNIVGFPVNEVVIYKTGHKWYKNLTPAKSICR